MERNFFTLFDVEKIKISKYTKKKNFSTRKKLAWRKEVRNKGGIFQGYFYEVWGKKSFF